MAATDTDAWVLHHANTAPPNFAPSIQARLTVLAVMCILPAVLMALVLIVHDYRQGKERLRAATLQTTRALGTAIDGQLHELHIGLAALAGSPALRDEDFVGFHAHATHFQSSTRADAIVLADPAGRQLINTLRKPGEALPAVNNAPLAAAMAVSRRPAVSSLFIGTLTGKPVIAVGVPVIIEDKVRYALSAGLGPQTIQNILDRQKLPAGWIAVVLDAQGTIVARSRDPGNFIGRKGSALLREQIDAKPEGRYDGVTQDGVAVFTSFTRSPAFGWAVAIGIPQEHLASQLWASLLWLAAGTAAALALSVYLALRFGGRIAQSVGHLTNASIALGRNEPVEVPPLAFQEANHLAQSMAHASMSLRLAYRDVREGESRLAAVLESALDGIIVVDQAQQIVSFNRAASKLFGYSREEALKMPLDRLLPEEARDRHREHVQRFAAGDEQPRMMHPSSRVVSGLRRDGTAFPMEASISAARVDGRQFLTVMVRDLTDITQTQDALTRSNLDLQQFAYVASHDMRSPLRSMKGFLTLLERGHASKLTPAGIELIRRATRAVDQLDQLTDDLLSYARLDATGRPMTACRLEQVVGDALTMLAAPIEESGARVVCKALPTVVCDPTQMVQLFQNLIGNAIKYRSQRTPKISVTATQDAQGWQVSVQDNGIGIAPEHTARVFTIFQRLHTQAEIPGSGMGLAICKRIVERHGGRLWVESELGQGCTFHFTLPCMGSS